MSTLLVCLFTNLGDILADFQLTESLTSTLSAAKDTYKKWCDRVDIASLEYTDMTRQTLKKHAVSPDAIMQLAIQVQ